MSSKLVDVISTHSFYNGLPEYFLHIMQLFEHARSFSHVAYFAGISLQTAPLARGAIEETNNSQFNLVSHLLSAQLKMRHFDEAYTTLSNILDPAFRDSARKTLVATILATCGPSAVALKKFRQLPFLVDLLSLCQTDDVLGSPAKTMESSVSFVDRPLSDVKLEDSFSLLKALYVAKINLESAAKTSYQRLCVLRHVASGAGRYTKQHLEVTQDYRSFSSVELITELLTLINLLASMESAEPYFIGNQNLLMTNNTSNENQGFEQGAPSSAPVDGAFDTVMLQPATEEPKSYESPSDRELSDNITLSTSKHGSSFEDSTYACDRLFLKQHASSGCAIVTLESLRREYQLELDRVCRIQNGDWEYGQTDH